MISTKFERDHPQLGRRMHIYDCQVTVITHKQATKSRDQIIKDVSLVDVNGDERLKADGVDLCEISGHL